MYLAVIYQLLALPLVLGPIEQQTANQTTTIRILPLLSWIPFDTQQHYWVGFFVLSTTTMSFFLTGVLPMASPKPSASFVQYLSH